MNETRKISDFIVQEIRHDLSVKIGFDIRAKTDCFKISLLILNETGGAVSGSTLYRMFLHKSKHVPYVYTLDVISEFLGFRNWSVALDYYKSTELKMLRMGLSISDDLNRSLLFQNIIHKAYKPLEGFFDGVNAESFSIKEAVTFSLYDSLKTISNTRSFFLRFSDHSFIREFFFEIGADPTFGIKDYEFGLKCYLRNSENMDSDIGLRDYVFANSLLFNYYSDLRNEKKAFRLGDEMFRDFDSMKRRVDSIHIFPKMRYLSLYLTYLNQKNSSEKVKFEYVSFLLKEAEQIAQESDMINRGIVFYQLAESFSKNHVNIEMQNQLKSIFNQDIQRLPDSIANASLQKIAPYFQPNGILKNRVNYVN